jgi:hypothetical protein
MSWRAFMPHAPSLDPSAQLELGNAGCQWPQSCRIAFRLPASAMRANDAGASETIGRIDRGGGSGGPFSGRPLFCPVTRLLPIEPGEQLPDVGGEIAARHAPRRPSQGHADAREEIDVVDAGRVFRFARLACAAHLQASAELPVPSARSVPRCACEGRGGRKRPRPARGGEAGRGFGGRRSRTGAPFAHASDGESQSAGASPVRGRFGDRPPAGAAGWRGGSASR